MAFSTTKLFVNERKGFLMAKNCFWRTETYKMEAFGVIGKTKT